MVHTVGSRREEQRKEQKIGGKESTRHRSAAILIFVSVCIAMPTEPVYAVSNTTSVVQCKANSVANVTEYKATTKNLNDILDGISSTMDLSKPSGISKEDYVYALENCPYDKNGILGENAELMWDLCNEAGINELFLPGLIALESGWCSSSISRNKHNIMSITGGKGYKSYDSYEECIRDGVRLISEKYLSPEGAYYKGDTLEDVGIIYTGYPSNAKDWARQIASCSKLCFKSLH